MQFGPGSSGSLGLICRGGRIYLTALLLGALLNSDNVEVNHVGLRMSSVYNELRTADSTLCAVVFKGYEPKQMIACSKEDLHIMPYVKNGARYVG